MNNPLFSNTQPQTSNIQQLVQRYEQFKRVFSGDAKQQVEQLLSSGRVSQQAYNNAYQMAQQLQRMMGGK